MTINSTEISSDVTSGSAKATITKAIFDTLLDKSKSTEGTSKEDLIQENSSQLQNFLDARNTYYTDYLMAAKVLGIVNGVGNNLFDPEKDITRQEMFVMLYNALQVIDEVPTGNVTRDLSSFYDAYQVTDWASEALSNLVKAGIVSGSNNKLIPTSSTTRAEIAQVLYNLLSK